MIVKQKFNQIKSLDDALAQIAHLKAFALNDFVAYEYLINLENHFDEMQTENGGKQTLIKLKSTSSSPLPYKFTFYYEVTVV